MVEELLALSHKTVVLQRNQYLKVKGTTDTNVYFVQSGSLKLFVLDDMEEQIIRFGYQGNLITAIDSFLTDKPSDLFIQALKRTTVAVIKKVQFQAFISLEAHKDWWLHTLQDLVVQQLQREIDILTQSPRERYKRVMERSPQLFQEIPHKHIANYLRMSAETLSRLKSVAFNQDLP